MLHITIYVILFPWSMVFMDKDKEKAIKQIMDSDIKCFVEGFELRYIAEVDDPLGVINSKKNNCFIAELGKEFMFYSAFVRSFDSSFGRVLENIGNAVAKLSYEVRNDIVSYLLPQQTQHIDYLMTEYDHHIKPRINDYEDFNYVTPRDLTSYSRSHRTDNYFYNPNTKEHFLIELKAGGDLDNKKARAEKIEMLHEYFLLKNKLNSEQEHSIKIYFATAYNKFGEGACWQQANVQKYFANEELLIGKDYWNFVCNDQNGFDIIFEQYQESSKHIKKALSKIKKIYFEEKQND